MNLLLRHLSFLTSTQSRGQPSLTAHLRSCIPLFNCARWIGVEQVTRPGHIGATKPTLLYTKQWGSPSQLPDHDELLRSKPRQGNVWYSLVAHGEFLDERGPPW